MLTSCNGFVYSFGAALLDLDQPWKVLYRTAPYLLSPQTLYECVGDVPNVAFPCAALVDAPTGRMAIYYGGADTVVGLAFAYVDEIIRFIKDNSWRVIWRRGNSFMKNFCNSSPNIATMCGAASACAPAR